MGFFSSISHIVASQEAKQAQEVKQKEAAEVLESLAESHGKENVDGALANFGLNQLKKVIMDPVNDSSLPQSLKDNIETLVDMATKEAEQPTIPAAQEAVNSEPSIQDAMTNASYAAAQSLDDEIGEGATGKGGTSWLVVLAGGLAKVQGDFLNASMKNVETMRANAEDSVAGSEGDQKDQEAARNAFLQAQNEFTANNQMFSMMANASATALKTIGEGLGALARKQ